MYLTPPEQPSCCKQVPVAVGLARAVLLWPWWPALLWGAAPGQPLVPKGLLWPGGGKMLQDGGGCSGGVWPSQTSQGLWGGGCCGSRVAPARTRARSFPQQRRRSPGRWHRARAQGHGAARLQPSAGASLRAAGASLKFCSASRPRRGEGKGSTGGEALWSPGQEARAGACLRGGALGSCSSCSSLVRYEGASGKRLR